MIKFSRYSICSWFYGLFKEIFFPWRTSQWHKIINDIIQSYKCKWYKNAKELGLLLLRCYRKFLIEKKDNEKKGSKFPLFEYNSLSLHIFLIIVYNIAFLLFKQFLTLSIGLCKNNIFYLKFWVNVILMSYKFCKNIDKVMIIDLHIVTLKPI